MKLKFISIFTTNNIANFSIPTLIYILVTYPLILNYTNSIYSDYFGDSVALLLFKPDFLIENTTDLYFTILSLFIKNNAVIYNLYIYTGSLLTYIFAYKLANEYLSDNHKKLFSTIFGIIVLITPIRLRYAMEWPSHAMWGFLILNILYQIKYYKNSTNKNALMLGLSIFLCGFQNPYHGVIALIISSILAVIILLRTKNVYIFIKTILSFIISFIPIYILFSLPLYKGQTLLNLAHRPEHDRWAYSSRIWDYIIPDIYNPIFGNLALNVRYFIWGLKPYYLTEVYFPKEHTLFLGFTLVIVISWFTFDRIRNLNRYKLNRSKITIFLTLIALISIYISFPPYISIQNITIFSPSYVLYNFIPQLRVYSRFGVIAIIIFQLIFTKQLQKISYKNNYIALFFALTLMAEYINLPPTHNIKLDPPEIYSFLSNSNYVILPAPRDYSDKYYSAITGSVQVDLDLKNSDLSNILLKEFCEYLNKNDIRYLIYNKELDRRHRLVEEFKNGSMPRDFKPMISKTWGDPIWGNHVSKNPYDIVNDLTIFNLNIQINKSGNFIFKKDFDNETLYEIRKECN